MKYLFLIITTALGLAFTTVKAQSHTPLNFSTFPSLQEITSRQPNGGFVIKPIKPAHATSTYGFFCRQELKMDKLTAMPVRFRLGSMEQCNQLEGKNR